MLLSLFLEFFKIGLFAVGGGMATLPFLYDLSSRTGWFTAQQIADMLAVSESTPGPIGINMATYVGFQCAGVPGSLAATIGMITPGIILVTIVAVFLHRFRNNPTVEAAFYGLRPCSAGLIAAAGIGVLSITLLRPELYQATGRIADLVLWKGVVLAVILWVLTNRVKCTKGFHPVVFIAVSAVIGIVLSFGGAV